MEMIEYSWLTVSKGRLPFSCLKVGDMFHIKHTEALMRAGFGLSFYKIIDGPEVVGIVRLPVKANSAN